MLKPCPCCGGTADYEQGRDRAFFVRCQDCGMRTGSFTWARGAGAAWNRLNTEGARIVTLFEIAELDHGQQDDNGVWSGWYETEYGLYAVTLETWIDLGETRVYLGGAYSGEGSPEWIEREGVDWRLWDRKPTEEQRRDAPWNGPAWRDARALYIVTQTQDASEEIGHAETCQEV